MMTFPRITLPLFIALGGGCNFTPEYRAPEMEMPTRFKESGDWKLARPAAHLPRGDWWSIFYDAELNTIMKAVEVSNQSLQSAAARAEGTAALLKSAKMAFIPTLDAFASATRSKSGSGGGSTNPNSLTSRGSGLQKSRSVFFATAWEADLWGRLRRGAGAATADAQAAQADVESTLLSLQSQAAQTYFSLRATDAQKRLLENEVASYQKSLDLTKNREAQGVASGADIALAQTQLANARVALIEVGVQRATLEHALAALTGRVPASFGLKEATLARGIPSLPAAAPSTLLQRRPDIAAAERRVAAANERVGVARAAFFPSLVLNADTGWRGLADLFAKSNNFWSLGVDLAEPILDRGQRIADKAQADAAWKGTVADYRQTVLTALQEAEDALATLRILAEESIAQDEALRAALGSERIATNQYKAGTLGYINVVIVQAAAFAAERNSLDLQLRRLNATVALIKAMGGAW